MAHTASIWLPVYSGSTGMKLELYPVSTDSIANGTGGDTLTEISGNKGLFTATIAETLSGEYKFLVKSSTGTLLAEGFTRSASVMKLGSIESESSQVLAAVSTIGEAANAIVERKTGPKPLRLYIGEAGSPVPVTLLKADGTAADLTGIATPATFAVANYLLEELMSEEVEVTESPAAFSFSPDAGVTVTSTKPGQSHYWSLRDASGIVQAEGRLEVLPTA